MTKKQGKTGMILMGVFVLWAHAPMAAFGSSETTNKLAMSAIEAVVNPECPPAPPCAPPPPRCSVRVVRDENGCAVGCRLLCPKE